MLSLQCSPPPSPSLYAPSSSFALPPRPVPPRRPSALRTSSSDHILAHAVTRFDTKPALIPSPSPDELPLRAPSPASLSSSSSSVRPSRPAPPIPTASSLPTRPPPKPLARSASQQGSASSGSLLARRRSSRSCARADIAPLLTDLKLDSLPSAGLDGLDDTVRPAVIGESAAAQTPVTDGEQQAKVVVRPFQPVKRHVSTPYAAKTDFLSDDDEDDSDADEDDKQARKRQPSSSSTSLASTSTEASSVFSPPADETQDKDVDALAEGVQWLPLQDLPAEKKDDSA